MSLRLGGMAKLVAFITVIGLLLVFSRFTVAYTPLPNGIVPLSDSARANVVVSSINGGVQSIDDPTADGDGTPQLVGVDTWSPSSDTVVVSPQVSSTGCTSQYQTSMSVSFTLSNRLSGDTKGAVNVSVFDYNNGLKLATDILSLSFKPGQDTSGTAAFNIISSTPDPVFLVTITFPTAAELSNGTPLQHVSLYQYFLYRAGVLDP